MKGSDNVKILIACEESQTVCTELCNLGHEAYSADIQEPLGGHPEWHILGDVLPLINGNCSFTTMDGTVHKIDGKWDLLIAHPPCTYLTSAGACRLMPKGKLDKNRLEKGIAAKFADNTAVYVRRKRYKKDLPLAKKSSAPYCNKQYWKAQCGYIYPPKRKTALQMLDTAIIIG